jgi:hypothetical protein
MATLGSIVEVFIVSPCQMSFRASSAKSREILVAHQSN